MTAARTVLVCLPSHARRSELVALATEALTARRVTPVGPTPYFLPRSRRWCPALSRRRSLSGGPVRLLDLDGMRRRSRDAAGQRWFVWKDVVAGTSPARPLWAFAEDDGRLSAARLGRYLAQPRLQAMALYNALPHRVCELPLDHVEALQLGHDGYVWLAWLAAVLADGLLDTTGGGDLVRPLGPQLNDRIHYLETAARQMANLHRRSNLIAMTVA